MTSDDWSLKGKLLEPNATTDIGHDPDIEWNIVPVVGMTTKGLYDEKPRVLTQKDIHDGTYYKDCMTTVDIDYGTKVYLESDIETLRQKIIKDLEELDERTHDREYNWLYDVTEIIDQRFGVE